MTEEVGFDSGSLVGDSLGVQGMEHGIMVLGLHVWEIPQEICMLGT